MDEVRAKALLIYGTDNAMDSINIYKDSLNGIAMDIEYLDNMLMFFKVNKLIDSYVIKTQWINKSIGHRSVNIEVHV